MDVQIIRKPALRVLGIEGCGDANKRSEGIKPLWDQALNRFEEI